MSKQLVEALEGLLSIIRESRGVAGYHLNGAIAEWDEFGEVASAEEALAEYKTATSAISKMETTIAELRQKLALACEESDHLDAELAKVIEDRDELARQVGELTTDEKGMKILSLLTVRRHDKEMIDDLQEEIARLKLEKPTPQGATS